MVGWKVEYWAGLMDKSSAELKVEWSVGQMVDKLVVMTAD